MEGHRRYRLTGSPDCPIAVGFFREDRVLMREPIWHPEVEIVYIDRGELGCLIGSSRTTLREGSLLILHPEQTHQFLSASPDALSIHLTFSLDAIDMPPPHVFRQEFVEPLREGLLQLPQFLEPEHPIYEQVVSVMKGLEQYRFNAPNFKIGRYAATVAICTALLPWCTKLEGVLLDPGIANATVRAAMLFIHKNYFDSITLEKIANHVHLHPSYLSTIFRQHTGKTVGQYLTQTRVNAAAALLTGEDLLMSRIAELSGFGSESAFFAQFKKHMGVSPKAYRALHQSPDK